MTIKKISKCIFVILTTLLSINCYSQTIPYISSNNQLIVDGKPFLMLGGELHNSSSSSIDYMETKWESLVKMNLNTVLAAISWEMVEPKEGVYDFSSLDNLVKKAREHNLRLVILWFGTWKNASSSYAPEWVRMDTKRFFRSEVNGEKLNHISCVCKEACVADTKAFTKLMERIKEIDQKEQTILSVQIENEVGMRWMDNNARWMPRDMSPKAIEAFEKQVPVELMNYLSKNKSKLVPEFIKIWERTNFKMNGTWTDVFLADASEVFMAWHTATYINNLAEAGKKVYPLPFFINVWMSFEEKFEKEMSNTYPSGSAVIKMMPIWKAGAPKVDIIAPDFYRNNNQDFLKICKLYKQMNNPLFVPEVRFENAPLNAISAMGMGAICFSPFAIDNEERFASCASDIKQYYELLNNLSPYLHKYHGTGNMIGFYGASGFEDFDMGKYTVRISFDDKGDGQKKPDPQKGCSGIIIATADDEFVIVGVGEGFSVKFIPQLGKPKYTEILWAYEMLFKDNKWANDRRLNGDETGLGNLHHTRVFYYDDEISVKKIKVFSFD